MSVHRFGMDKCGCAGDYCYAGGGDEKIHMSWQVARSAVDLMLERSDSFKIPFTGGEPLLNFDLLEKILLYLEDGGADASCQVQTNATLIDAEMADKLKGLGHAREIVEPPFICRRCSDAWLCGGCCLAYVSSMGGD